MATDFIITDIYKEEPGLDTQKIDDKLLMQFFETMVTIRSVSYTHLTLPTKRIV